MIELKKKEKVITSASVMTKATGEKVVKINYVQAVPVQNQFRTDKEWKQHQQFQDVVKFEFVNFNDVSKSEKFKWKSDQEICQELRGKSICFSTFLNL